MTEPDNAPAPDGAAALTTPPVPVLDTPRGGMPPIVDTPHALDETLTRLREGSGPIGIDTERASGFRYSQRAYLVQLYREDAGTFIVDPVAFDGLSPIAEATRGIEHIFHAASQDLPCLKDAGYLPDTIFDTELAGRLLGYEKVGLGSMVEKLLGVHLRKAYSAVDWSTRPLPREWITYAALDVQLLPELRRILREQLIEAGKQRIAREEFDAVLASEPKAPRSEPWRRLSGIHALRKPRQLAIARALWQARDDYARVTDIAPGRVIPDAAIVAAAREEPHSIEELRALRAFTGRASRAEMSRWWHAISEAQNAPVPSLAAPHQDGSFPPVKAWEHKNPDAFCRLHAAREDIAQVSERTHIPAENLLSPRLLRELAWQGVAAEGLRAALSDGGARPWQIELIAPVVAGAFERAGASVPAE
ncbi:MAG TPA: ribonuclease D [Pseudoclavibacter sp.]|nr:ribonuclease D [Pseudoclavibacter sp.]